MLPNLHPFKGSVSSDIGDLELYRLKKEQICSWTFFGQLDFYFNLELVSNFENISTLNKLVLLEPL